MWTRKELKTKAKSNLKNIYWKLLFLLIVFGIVSGGFLLPSVSLNIFNNIKSRGSIIQNLNEGLHNGAFPVPNNNISDPNQVSNDINANVSDLLPFLKDKGNNGDKKPAWFNMSIKPAAGGLTSLLVIFIAMPFYVGIIKFILRSKQGQGKLEDALPLKGYLNIVFGMFLKRLFITLWGLLFIIPGIIKNYEYYMIPYILADNPEIGFERAKKLSREMTRGNKMKIFILEVSFWGWYILGLICFGVGISFVAPYVEATKAELYLKLKESVSSEI